MVVVTVLALTGCTRTTQADGSTFCGVHLDTGAESIVFTPLDPRVPPPGPAPTRSALPPPATGQIQTEYVRTAPDCDHGAIVTVVPPDAARLVRGFAGPRGGLIGVMLDQVTGRAQVSAWLDGRYLGGLVLGPHAPSLAPS